MCNINQCMAPFRHVYQAILTDHGVVVWVLIAPKTQSFGIVFSHVTNLSNFFKRLRQLRRIVDIKVNMSPLFRYRSPFHQRLGLQAGFNGQ